MTIEELKNYRKLTYTIRYWKNELELLRKESYVRSPSLSGMPGSGDIKDPTGDRALKESKVMERIERLYEEQQRERDRIMDWIETIDDPLVQAIMHARYIRQKSWAAVAHLIGGNNTPDSVRMAHNRYLFGSFTYNK